MRKRWLSELLCLCLVLSLLPIAAYAQTLETYMALGDSITTGYGLGEGAQSFAKQVATASGLTLDDALATDGLTSAGLLAQLSDADAKTAVTDTDFITITIGGNDLLGALYGYLAASYNAAHPDEPQMTAEKITEKLASLTMSDVNLVKELIGYMPGFQNSDAAENALTAYSANLTAILSAIRTLNSDVQVVVLNQYNPYKQAAKNADSLFAAFGVNISQVSDAFEAGVTALNLATTGVVTALQDANVQIADVKAVFDAQAANPCNADFSNLDTLSFDIHPNAAGHQLLAGVVGEIVDALQASSTPSSTVSGDTTFDPNENVYNGMHFAITLPEAYQDAKVTGVLADGKALTYWDDYWFNFNSTTPTVVVSNTYFMGIMAGLEEAKTVTLTFQMSKGNNPTIDVTIPATYKLTLASDPVDAAYCFVAGRQYDDCYYVTRGEEVTLEGLSYVGYVFDSWRDETGETLSATSEYTFTPEEDTTLVMHCVPSVYELTAAPDDIDFGTKAVGYAEVAAQTVTVTNTGNDWLLLAQPEAEKYVISQIAEEDRYLEAGETVAFTIRPETGLPAGNYDTTITVTEDTNMPEPIALSLRLGDGEAEEPPETLPGAASDEIKVSFTVRHAGSGSTTDRYTLYYESNGGTQYPDERYTEGTTVELTKEPTRDDFVFTGWYADEDLTKAVDHVVMNSDKTVYAGWRYTGVPAQLNGADHVAYIVGYGGGTVNPTGQITRAEVATIFFRLLQDDVREKYLTSDNDFTDVGQDDWYCTAVSTLSAMGVLEGRTAETFEPNAPITRAEFAAIAVRFDDSGLSPAGSFTDIAGHWAKDEIRQAAELGWITGYADGSFRPNQSITRAEAVTMLNRVLQRLPETEKDLLSGMRTFSDCQSSDWFYLAIQEATNSHDYTRRADGYESWDELLPDPDWSQYQ